MTREDVIEALEYLISDDCTDTASEYRNEIKTAIELIKAQEPRVLTLAEAKVVLKTEPVIWFEVIGEGIVAGLRMSGMDYFTMTTDEVMDEDTFDDDLVSKLYGIKFRMWSCKPTDAQRKVTPWETGITNG